MSKINFDLVSIPEKVSLFLSLPADIDEKVSVHPNIHERMQGALSMAWCICDRMTVNGTDMRKLQCFLRAALSELVSIEEVIKKDLPISKYKLGQDGNPLLILLRELRHYNVHMDTSKVNAKKVIVTYKDRTFENDICVIDNLSSVELCKLRNFKNTDPKQVEKLIEWFDVLQNHIGIPYVIKMAVELCAKEILDATV